MCTPKSFRGWLTFELQNGGLTLQEHPIDIVQLLLQVYVLLPTQHLHGTVVAVATGQGDTKHGEGWRAMAVR